MQDHISYPEYLDGWYGQVFKKLNNFELASMRFNHANIAPVLESPVFNEFILYVAMCTDLSTQSVFWDFVQSTSFSFPEAIHLKEFYFIINIIDTEVIIPKPPKGRKTYLGFHEDSESRVTYL